MNDLLKPRYKVIADWPGMIGIIVGHTLMQGIHQHNSRAGWYNENGYRVHGPEFYPHLFRKIEWWEERKPEEMPEYAKNLFGTVLKVKEWRIELKFLVWVSEDGETDYEKLSAYLPATKEEYESYLSQTKSKP